MKRLNVLIKISRDLHLDEDDFKLEAFYSEQRQGFKRIEECDENIQKAAAKLSPVVPDAFYFDVEKQQSVYVNEYEEHKADKPGNLVFSSMPVDLSFYRTLRSETREVWMLSNFIAEFAWNLHDLDCLQKGEYSDDYEAGNIFVKCGKNPRREILPSLEMKDLNGLLKEYFDE